MTWRWISKEAVLAIHKEQLAEHGGSPGIRDEGLLESALNRPYNLFVYNNPGIAELAAAYAFGIVQNHPFIDGNKRTGFIVAVTFLILNGFDVIASEKDVIEIFLQLAESKLPEEDLSIWFKNNLIKSN